MDRGFKVQSPEPRRRIRGRNLQSAGGCGADPLCSGRSVLLRGGCRGAFQVGFSRVMSCALHISSYRTHKAISQAFKWSNILYIMLKNYTLEICLGEGNPFHPSPHPPSSFTLETLEFSQPIAGLGKSFTLHTRTSTILRHQP